MRLYHFTHRERVPIIKKWGIAKGDVPISHSTGYNAPWFTSDPRWESQGWTQPHLCAFDKSEVRITVEIDESDPKLWKWHDLAKDLNIEKHWLEALDSASGTNLMGAPSSSNFYVFHDIVHPDMFVEIEYRDRPVTYCVGARGQKLEHEGDEVRLKAKMMVDFAKVALDEGTRSFENQNDYEEAHPYHVKCGLSGSWPLMLFGTTFEPEVLDRQMDEVESLGRKNDKS